MSQGDAQSSSRRTVRKVTDEIAQQYARLLIGVRSSATAPTSAPPLFHGQEVRVLERLPSVSRVLEMQDGLYILHEPGKRATGTDWKNFNGTSANKGWPLELTASSPGQEVTKGWLLQCAAVMKEPHEAVKARRFYFKPGVYEDQPTLFREKSKEDRDKEDGDKEDRDKEDREFSIIELTGTDSIRASQAATHRVMESFTDMMRRFRQGEVSAKDLDNYCHPQTGWTVLHNYARHGNLAEVRELLDAGMDASVRSSKNGTTPLHLAAYGGHPEVVELLLERGADPDARTAPGNWSPFHNAVRTEPNRNGLVLLEKQKRIIRLLVAHGMPLPEPEHTVNHPLSHLSEPLFKEGCEEARRIHPGEAPGFQSHPGEAPGFQSHPGEALGFQSQDMSLPPLPFPIDLTAAMDEWPVLGE